MRMSGVMPMHDIGMIIVMRAREVEMLRREERQAQQAERSRTSGGPSNDLSKGHGEIMVCETRRVKRLMAL